MKQNVSPCSLIELILFSLDSPLDPPLIIEVATYYHSSQVSYVSGQIFTIDMSRGVMPYMCHRKTCCQSGYTFWPSNPRQGVFFEPDSKTGCQICKINPSQGTYSQYCLPPSHWFQLISLLFRKLIPVLMFSTYS